MPGTPTHQEVARRSQARSLMANTSISRVQILERFPLERKFTES